MSTGILVIEITSGVPLRNSIPDQIELVSNTINGSNKQLVMTITFLALNHQKNYSNSSNPEIILFGKISKQKLCKAFLAKI